MKSTAIEPELVTEDQGPMTLADVLKNLPDPPQPDPQRIFAVRRPDRLIPLTSGNVQHEEVWDTQLAHNVEVGASTGALMFFETIFEIGPIAPNKIGFRPISMLRRMLPPGQWLDVKEQMVPSGSSLVTVN